jgi:hypothetical protein
MLPFRLVMGLAVAINLLPIASVVASVLIASQAGCAVDEGGVHPCIIQGFDYGEALGVMFVLGWLSLITVPAIPLIVAVWAVGEIIHFRRKARWRPFKS